MPVSGENEINVALILQRIETIIDRQSDLTKRLDALSESLAATYVPRGEYEARRETLNQHIKSLEKDIEDMRQQEKADVSFRRQVSLSLGLLAITTLVTISIAITNMLTR